MALPQERRLMHALVADGFDGIYGLMHVDVPIPTPSKDEVLIKLEATSLNPFDWKAHKLRVLLHPFSFRNSPLIPCTDVAGEVVKIGSGVQNFNPGDKVVAYLNFPRGGGLSEYAVAKEISTVLRPPQVSAAQGAGLPIAGLTAHSALTEIAQINLDKTTAQKNILITAASGGVGHYAVQLAKLGNHHVTATCGDRNIELVKSLGADEVLDYRSPNGKVLRSPSGRKYDAVIHCATEIPWSVFKENISENGIVVDLTPGLRDLCTSAVKKLSRHKKKMVPFLRKPNGDYRDSLGYLVDLVKDGKVKTVIDSIHPLWKAEEAWSEARSGHATGKIIVEQ